MLAVSYLPSTPYTVGLSQIWINDKGRRQRKQITLVWLFLLYSTSKSAKYHPRCSHGQKLFCIVNFLISRKRAPEMNSSLGSTTFPCQVSESHSGQYETIGKENKHVWLKFPCRRYILRDERISVSSNHTCPTRTGRIFRTALETDATVLKASSHRSISHGCDSFMNCIVNHTLDPFSESRIPTA